MFSLWSLTPALMLTSVSVLHAPKESSAVALAVSLRGLHTQAGGCFHVFSTDVAGGCGTVSSCG